MPRYMVVHSTAGITDQEEAVAGARKLVRSLPPETKWINSWMALQKAKMFCEWSDMYLMQTIIWRVGCTRHRHPAGRDGAGDRKHAGGSDL